MGSGTVNTGTYEVRDPIYGFIPFNDWERQVIDSPIFQRLRRIRQLALTDMVYPGATHTRFEHSLGVMHVATQMFDAIVKRALPYLSSELGYNAAGIERMRALVRMAALLHDIGHSPFSHPGESVLPKNPQTDKPYKHEDYSAYIVRHLLAATIEDHPFNQQNYNIRAAEVADLLEGDPGLGTRLFWRSLICGQIDADRADYLLRDSYHIGVKYGVFDLERLLATLTAARDPDTERPTVAVEEGGLHAAESLVLARYQMFTQVYFQHTRRALDHHVEGVLRNLLGGTFPPPTSVEALQEYLEWDDWRVLGEVRSGGGGRDGRILRERTHDVCVYHTTEVPSIQELEQLQALTERLGDLISFVDEASRSWYAMGEDDVAVLCNPGKSYERVRRLSELSNVVAGLKPVRQRRVYVPREAKAAALEEVRAYMRGGSWVGGTTDPVA